KGPAGVPAPSMDPFSIHAARVVTVAKGIDVVGDAVDGTLARSPAGPGGVRRDDQVIRLVIDQRMAGARWFDVQYVDTGAGDNTALQGVDQGLGIDDGAASRVDEYGAGFHAGQRLGVDQATGGVS